MAGTTLMRRVIPVLAALVSLLGAPATGGQQAEFSQQAARIAANPALRHAVLGLAVVDLASGELLYASNGDKMFPPASTEKLFTEGAVLALLGSDYRYHTRVYGTGSMRGNVLDGDLVLVASGDPNLSGRVVSASALRFLPRDNVGGQPDWPDPLLALRTIAAEVKARGIERITGTVDIDTNLFPQGKVERGTQNTVSPIVVNDNVVDVEIVPGAVGDRPAIHVSPDIGFVVPTNELTTVASGVPRVFNFDDTARTTGGAVALALAGQIPRGEPVHFAYPVRDPRAFAAAALKRTLMDAGIAIESNSASAASSMPRTLLVDYVSPPLSEDVRITLKVSQNLHAVIAPYVLGSGVARTPAGAQAAGFDRIRAFLTSCGLDSDGIAMEDAAGGDGASSVTPSFMVAFLRAMATRPEFGRFEGALPILGEDGTLRTIGRSSAAAGHVRAKTGSIVYYDWLNRRFVVTAKSLAGYITARSGRRLAFAAFATRTPVAEPVDITGTVGQVLADLAAAAYETF